MNIAKRHIEGATKILAAAGATATRSIVIPLLPEQGSWVITGTVQAVRADGQFGPVTFFPQFTGGCVRGIATMTAGAIPTLPVDGGGDQRFYPDGLSLLGAEGQGLQLEIALTGEADVEIIWAWELDVLLVATA